MTVIPPQNVTYPTPGDEYARIVKWGPALNGDVGGAVDLTQYADRTVQVEGSFGSGGQCVIEGSNDGVNYRTLHDPFSVALVMTALSIAQVTEVTTLIRPRIAAGDGSTSLVVTMFARKPVR